MTMFRRFLRSWAMVWLVLQSTSLAALVPRDCCAAHERVAAKDCHGGHDGARTSHQKSDCVVRGTCDGPPLFTLFVGTGVLPDLAVMTAPPPSRALASDLREEPLARIQPPISPPPRG